MNLNSCKTCGAGRFAPFSPHHLNHLCQCSHLLPFVLNAILPFLFTGKYSEQYSASSCATCRPGVYHSFVRDKSPCQVPLIFVAEHTFSIAVHRQLFQCACEQRVFIMPGRYVVSRLSLRPLPLGLQPHFPFFFLPTLILRHILARRSRLLPSAPRVQAWREGVRSADIVNRSTVHAVPSGPLLGHRQRQLLHCVCAR